MFKPIKDTKVNRKWAAIVKEEREKGLLIPDIVQKYEKDIKKDEVEISGTTAYYLRHCFDSFV